MNKLVEDSRLESDIFVLLNYYKLLYIENLTKDKGYSAFEMLGGKKAFDRLLNNVNEGSFSLEYSNFDIMTNFKSRVEKLANKQIITSISPVIDKELKNIEWVSDVLEFIEPNDKVYDSILLNANTEVFDKMVCQETRLRFSQYYRKYLMSKRFDDVKKLLKK